MTVNSINYFNYLEKIDNIFYKHNHYYIYLMTIYHLIIILFTVYISKDIPSKAFFVLDFNISSIENIQNNFRFESFKSLMFTFIIMLVDFIFLVILMMEFKSLNLSFKKIFILEVFIFYFAFTYPVFRMILLFFSLNTLQITFFYKLIKYVPFGKYLFLTGSYILIIKLLLYPFIMIYSLT